MSDKIGCAEWLNTDLSARHIVISEEVVIEAINKEHVTRRFQANFEGLIPHWVFASFRFNLRPIDSAITCQLQERIHLCEPFSITIQLCLDDFQNQCTAINIMLLAQTAS